MAQNFKVGDKVVNIQSLQFWNNIYHHKMALTYKPLTVVAADEKFFTCHNVAKFERFSGLSSDDDQRVVAQQKNGETWSGSTVYRQVATARKILQDSYAAEMERCDADDAKEIAKLEAEIAHLQAKIQKVKDGKRPVSYDNRIVEREFLANSFQAAMNNLA